MSGKQTGSPGCHGDRAAGLFPPAIGSGNGILQESGKIGQKYKAAASAGKTKVGHPSWTKVGQSPSILKKTVLLTTYEILVGILHSNSHQQGNNAEDIVYIDFVS